MTLRKRDDVVIYSDEMYYSTFPSVVCRPDGQLICAFRRAPERRIRPHGEVTHSDPNSWLMAVTSEDNGRTWSSDPTAIFIHPSAGNQDPCLLQLRDGTLLCTTYSWELLCKDDAVHEGARETPTGWVMTCLGVNVIRSDDGGATWDGSWYIDPCPEYPEHFPGKPNRGACRGRMVELDDGTILMPVSIAIGTDHPNVARVYSSADRGQTWRPGAIIAADSTVHFHEPHLHMTPSGRLICLLRTQELGGYLAWCHSDDLGATWSEWTPSTIWGHPFTTAVCPDGRVLVAYGYRREPFGIRCKLVNPEFDNLDAAEEFVIRDDGGSSDIGYPWAVQTADGNMFIAYYMNHDLGTKHAAESIPEIDNAQRWLMECGRSTRYVAGSILEID